MLYLSSLEEAQPVLKALSAPMRAEIMRIIYRTPGVSMNGLAQALGLTNSAVTMHVNRLAQAGLVRIDTASGRHGTMKLVSPRHRRLVIDMAPGGQEDDRHFYQDEVRVGCFTSCLVAPTCGLATSQGMVGAFDDVNAFTFPEHFDAGILWFTSGYVEYGLPNRLQAGQRPVELQISFEISSEYPGFNKDYPSDIHFSFNGTALGVWVSPGDYGDRRGHVSPAWWPPSLNQYGLLKTLIVNGEGTFMDGGQKLSDITVDDLCLDYNTPLLFRIEVPEGTQNCGGCTLFGEGFGDYAQAIRVKLFYR